MNEQNQIPNFETTIDSQSNIYQRNFSVQECVFGWLCVLVGYIIARAFPVTEYPLGTFIAGVLAVASGFYVFIKNKKRLGAVAIFSAVICLALSAVPLFTASSFAVITSFVLAIMAYCYFLYSAYDNCLEQGISNFILLDFVNVLIIYPLNNFGKLFGAMFSGEKKSYRLAIKIVLGVLAGIIPAAIVVGQLEYDDKFLSIMYEIKVFFRYFDLFSHIISLLVGVMLALLIFSIYYSSVEKTKSAVSIDDTREYLKAVKAVPAVTIAFALLPLLIVYIIFFVSQWDYYTSAFKGILPQELIYSTYARDGFFQLCRVSGINLALVSAVSLFSSQKEKGSDLFLRIVKILFAVITLVLIATAISKMWIYIQGYGLTVKRLLSTWLMLVIALIFVLVIVKQFVPKIKTPAGSIIIALVMFLILSFSNYQGFIADYNVDRYLNGKFEQTDVNSLNKLGTEAVPAMVRLAEYYQKEYGFSPDPEYPNDKYDKEYSAYFRLNSALRAYRRENTVFEFSIPAYRAKRASEAYFGE